MANIKIAAESKGIGFLAEFRNVGVPESCLAFRTV